MRVYLLRNAICGAFRKDKVMRTTWKPLEEGGELSTEERNNLPDSVFAFPEQRKEPLTDANHVRNALALSLIHI